MPGETSVRHALYVDLAAAGLKRRFENGDICDFHTFRSTAICWAITIRKLNLLDVQAVARLKTLALVQKYVRRYVPDHANLIKGSPEFTFVASSGCVAGKVAACDALLDKEPTISNKRVVRAGQPIAHVETK